MLPMELPGLHEIALRKRDPNDDDRLHPLTSLHFTINNENTTSNSNSPTYINASGFIETFYFISYYNFSSTTATAESSSK
ncbi:hypothetical protein CEXT_286871 [Caerostris extrusa]|uniref:Uncharacterized protein n=1 Tax=Caerostris extrusa TaxID=172846 RepID=A0AAV4TEQ4_CAEEX|nr:hypothetical protein CEXT_286871 [Caerostris extrusa]